MTDTELTKLCAAAMGIYLEWDGPPADYQPMYYEGKTYHLYDPLHNDAQCFALARKFPIEFEVAVIEWANHVRRGEPFNINRSFCARIAQKQAEGK